MVVSEIEYYCSDCPRNCNALRTETEGSGFCSAGLNPVIAKAYPHLWEEPCISGSKGSGTIFFSGCVLKCVYCQNCKISRKPLGKTHTPDGLIDIVKSLEQQGVHNINLVTPTHYTDAIIKAFSKYKPSIPVVYNCGGYESVDTLKKLNGIIDIYMPDFKYYYSDTAIKYSKANNYKEIAVNAIYEMLRQTGNPVFDDNGILLKGTIVRHLILPGHTDESIKILELLDLHFSTDILISLMHQYCPAGDAHKFPNLNRKLSVNEYNKILDRLFELSLDGFVQESSSAKECYTPDFDV